MLKLKGHHKNSVVGTNSNNVSKEQSKIVISTGADTAEIINGVEHALSTQYKIDYSTAEPPNSNTLSLNAFSGGPVMSVSGYSFEVAPPRGTDLSVRAYQSSSNTLPDVSNIISLIASEFSTLKLNKIQGTNAAAGTANYQDSIAYCNFNDSSNSQDITYPFDISCADKSDYAQEASIMSPLVKAYYKSNPTPPSNA
jgi:hypothetical protein